MPQPTLAHETLTTIPIKRALISVSDKSGLDQLAPLLCSLGVEIIASGGSARFLNSLGIPTVPLEEVTGNPEAFGGRMKTLSFAIGAGLLFRRDQSQDVSEAQRLHIKPIDLVICNLYPFEENLKLYRQEKISSADLIEKIDIGGPTMVRAAAKNFKHVTVLTDPSQYQQLANELEKHKATTLGLRSQLAKEAFLMSAHYEHVIAKWWQEFDGGHEESPAMPLFNQDKALKLRYGENPHQKAWVIPQGEGKLAQALPLQGKALSYNNYLDSDAAWKCLKDLDQLSHHPLFQAKNLNFAAVVIKHANPCGQALGKSAQAAFEMSWNGDATSSFGSVMAFNFKVEANLAQLLSERFIEVVLAPDFDPVALEILSKKKNLRLLKMDLSRPLDKYSVRSIEGGLLWQEQDLLDDQKFCSKVERVTGRSLDELGQELLVFGQVVVKHLKSNAIALVKKSTEGELFLAGSGVGNPNRLLSVKQALELAAHNKHFDFNQMLLVSDAFFPFEDNIHTMADSGVKYLIAPKGSIRDKDVIAACNQRDLGMGMFETRHFRH